METNFQMFFNSVCDLCKVKASFQCQPVNIVRIHYFYVKNVNHTHNNIKN